MFTGSKATASQHEHGNTTSYTVEEEDEGKDQKEPHSSNPATASEVEGLLGQLQVSDSVTSLSEPSSSEPLPLSQAALRPPPIIHPNLLSPESLDRHPLFKATQLGVDRRLLVNRKRQLKMYRVWMQGQFRKPIQGE
jgi:tRNAThr (cytosine32-N3)-methyltransferase